METKVIEIDDKDENHGKTTDGGRTFSGGLLDLQEVVSGWTILSKIPVVSGEADLYIAEKEGQKGVIKYYHNKLKPKTALLEKIKNLNNPYIVNVFEFGMYRERFYEIMEYAAGGSLDSRDEKGNYKYLPLPEEKVLKICGELNEAFKACHDLGIVHRDIKPANIYLRDSKTQEALIGDFGISSIMEEAGENTVHRTQTASRTTGYAAPEVLTGIISAKMDYYALGITLWELATGKNPFLLDNGKARNDAHLIRDTIEGRIVDDILTKEPILNEKMQHLIRGLLTIDPNNRWGYEEVKKHLNGEFVEIKKSISKAWKFSIGNVECSSLEEIAKVINDDFEACTKEIFRGYLSGFLEDKYPEIAEKISNAVEKASAQNNNALAKPVILWALKPDFPLLLPNGFEATNVDDIYRLTVNAPETMYQMYRDFNSSLYVYLGLIGLGEKIPVIQNVIKNNPSTEDDCLFVLYEIAIILHDYRLIPFTQPEYKDIEMSTLEQLINIPKELRDIILMLIREKSCDGFVIPWIMALAERDNKKINLDRISDWNDLKNILR